MKTPAQYHHDIQNLHLEALEKASMSQLDEIEKSLLDLERSLAHDLQALRAQHQGRLAAIGVPSARHRPAKEKVEEEQRVMDIREEKMHPYEELKGILKEHLEKVQQLKSTQAKA